jgi:hypothetical protein
MKELSWKNGRRDQRKEQETGIKGKLELYESLSNEGDNNFWCLVCINRYKADHE